MAARTIFNTNAATFTNDGYICLVERDPNELEEHFILRGEFIVKQKPMTDLDYATCVTYSRIYVNVMVKKCTYNQAITEMLNTLTKPCTK